MQEKYQKKRLDVITFIILQYLEIYILALVEFRMFLPDDATCKHL